MSTDPPSGSTVWKTGDQLSAPELYALLSLRVDVFVVEQDCAYAETDGHDMTPTTLHGWRSDAHGVAVAVRILNADASVPTMSQIGRVVTRADRRGEGLAAAIVLEAGERCDSTGSSLEAQTHLVEWYQRLGWSVVGREYVEDGIPHTPMARNPRREGTDPGS